MMRNIIFISITLFLVISFYSCKKDGTNYSAPFKINGVRDLTIDVNGSAAMPVEVEYVAGSHLEVSLSVSGLPKLVLADILPATGKPPFNASITIYALNADPGTYDVSVKGKTSSRELTYTFRLKITKSFAVDSVVGIYSGNIRDAASWYFPYPVVDSGSYDSTRPGIFTVTRISDDSIRAGFGSDPTQHNNYRFVNSSVPCVIGDPNHGGHYFNFHPAKDSVFFHTGSGGSGGNGYSYKTLEFSGKK